MHEFSKPAMNIIEKLNEAATLIREAAQELEQESLLELDFEIRIKPQRPTVTLSLKTELGENAPPPNQSLK